MSQPIFGTLLPILACRNQFLATRTDYVERTSGIASTYCSFSDPRSATSCHNTLLNVPKYSHNTCAHDAVDRLRLPSPVYILRCGAWYFCSSLPLNRLSLPGSASYNLRQADTTIRKSFFAIDDGEGIRFLEVVLIVLFIE